MNESPGTFELLSARVDELEKRVHALEHPDEVKASSANRVIGAASAASDGGTDSLQTANIFPLLGRAMLGIAGAYVLRAVAEVGVMPKGAVAAVAIAYAFAWLVWAARGRRVSRFTPLVYAGTSAVILVPLLWEETLHFHVLSPIVTALVLAAFVALAAVLEWSRESSRVLWLAYCAASAAAILIAIAARAMLPFVFVLLLIVLLCEIARVLGHARPMWFFVVVIADAAIWGMIFIYSGPRSARADYPELSVVTLLFAAGMLFAINATGLSWRAILQGKTTGIFEVVQVMMAFVLAIASVLLFAPPVGTMILGISCLILSAAAYDSSFRYLRKLPEPRNFQVFSTWSGGLLLAGALWSLPKTGAGIALAIAALAASIVAAQIDSRMLEFHAATFLCTATVVAGVAHYVFRALASTLPGQPAAAVWIVACSAVTSYVKGKDVKDDGWAHQLLELVPALLAASAVSALLVHGALLCATLAVPLEVHHIAFLRTLVISAVSLCLAYAGSRWGRLAMTRLAYVALAFIAAKLLFEDLRHGHMEFIAGSIFLFAMTLIVVPRLVRMGASSRAASHERIPVHI